jgi:hypothetical protein
MADDSELDYIRTFVGEVMTGYTIKQFSEVKTIASINDTQRGLVYPGEILTFNDVYYVTRYKLKLSDTTELSLTAGIKLLIAGAKKYNSRLAGVTQVASMTHINLASANQAYEDGITKRWNQDIMFDITWSVA